MHRAPAFRGRSSEREVLDRLLENVRGGQSAVLVIHGEPGVRTAETRDDLTAQEEQIAGLARDGLSNPEIGARLFLSPRTVEWHLHNVFAKLGISSRTGLHDAMPSDDRNAALA